jgi:hypothetical protein
VLQPPALRRQPASGAALRRRRDGDISSEHAPISEFFLPKPEFCRGNTFAIEGGTFTLRSQAATIVGSASPGATPPRERSTWPRTLCGMALSKYY